MLCLKPREFEELQPGEFYKLSEGYEIRHDAEVTAHAYFVSNLMNLFGKSLKQNMPVDRLAKPLRLRETDSSSRDEDEQYLREKFGL